MRVLKTVLAVSTLAVTAAACGGDAQPSTLERDLAWLDSVSVQTHPQVPVSALEMTPLAAPVPVAAPVVEEKPEAEPAEEKPAARRSASRRSSGSSSASRRSSGSSGTYTSSAPARQPRVVTKRNTVRDAAIGVGVGGVVGAVAGGRKHRVRGALIGAAVGGAAGAVIGSTVDTQKRVEY
jgi:hypothetical protein